MLDNSIFALVGAGKKLLENRKLISRLVKHDIESKYRGSLFGVIWTLLNPVLMLFIFAFVFGVVYQARWSGSGSETDTRAFALIIFLGLTVYNFVAEAISRAPTLILSNTSYVKKVVFPLEILPFVVLLSSLFQMFISILMFMCFYPFVFGVPPVEIFLLPLVVLPLIIGVLGTSWLLASLGVFIRDLSQFIPLALTALLFLSPIFFPLEALPDTLRYWIGMGPLAPVLENLRAVVIDGRQPDWLGVGRYAIVAVIWATFGYWWFFRTQRGFADVL